MAEKHELDLSDQMNMSGDMSHLDIEQLMPDDVPESCEECPWNRFCLDTPVVTEEEAEEFLSKKLPTGDQMQDAMFATWVRERLTSLPACPLFIERVKEDGDFVRDIKKVMKGEAKIVEDE